MRPVSNPRRDVRKLFFFYPWTARFFCCVNICVEVNRSRADDRSIHATRRPPSVYSECFRHVDYCRYMIIMAFRRMLTANRLHRSEACFKKVIVTGQRKRFHLLYVIRSSVAVFTESCVFSC
jgi:hypothetical protein